MLFKTLFEKLKAGLAKTKEALGRKIKDLFAGFRNLDEATIARLEEILISADVGVEATDKIITDLKRSYKQGNIKSQDLALNYLKTSLKTLVMTDSSNINLAVSPPTVMLIVGVNGTGKTTSIAKLARLFKDEKKSVIIAACDTFRAAAIDQLAIWAQRAGAELIRHQHGGDPAAVCFDALEASLARKIDVLIVDTAGRLQTKHDLMRELAKINKVISKKIPDAPHEVLLVLDATTGQNAISQAEHFNDSTKLTGIFLSKLDGTAKGGIIIAIKNKFNIPVKFVGVGEGLEDIALFDSETFIDTIFE